MVAPIVSETRRRRVTCARNGGDAPPFGLVFCRMLPVIVQTMILVYTLPVGANEGSLALEVCARESRLKCGGGSVKEVGVRGNVGELYAMF